MSNGTPNPRYYKDGNGLRPRWRLWLHHPLWAAWLSSPRWFVKARCRWNDRNHVRVALVLPLNTEEGKPE